MRQPAISTTPGWSRDAALCPLNTRQCHWPGQCVAAAQTPIIKPAGSNLTLFICFTPPCRTLISLVYSEESWFITLCPFADEIPELDSSASTQQPFLMTFQRLKGGLILQNRISGQADPSVAGGARALFTVFKICLSVRTSTLTITGLWHQIGSQNFRFHPLGRAGEMCQKAQKLTR